MDDLRIGVDYPGGDHLGRVSGAGLSVRDVSRSRLSLVLRSLVRKSTTTSYFEQKKDKKLQFLTGWTKSHVKVLCTLLSSGLAILLPACGNNDAGEGQNCDNQRPHHLLKLPFAATICARALITRLTQLTCLLGCARASLVSSEKIQLHRASPQTCQQTWKKQKY